MSRLLFNDECPVSEEEIKEWLDSIPNLSATESRRQAYRIAYNVDEKIRAQKRISSDHAVNVQKPDV